MMVFLSDRQLDFLLHALILFAQVAARPPVVDVESLPQVFAEALAKVLRRRFGVFRRGDL